MQALVELAIGLVIAGLFTSAGWGIAASATRRASLVRRRDGALRAPECAVCGFPIRGLERPRCPECGADLEQVGVACRVDPPPWRAALETILAGGLAGYGVFLFAVALSQPVVRWLEISGHAEWGPTAILFPIGLVLLRAAARRRGVHFRARSRHPVPWDPALLSRAAES